MNRCCNGCLTRCCRSSPKREKGAQHESNPSGPITKKTKTTDTTSKDDPGTAVFGCSLARREELIEGERLGQREAFGRQDVFCKQGDHFGVRE